MNIKKLKPKRIMTLLEGFGRPIFLEISSKLNPLYQEIKPNNSKLRLVAEGIKGFKNGENIATTENGLHWFRKSFNIEERGEIAVLFPPVNEKNRSIAVYSIGLISAQDIHKVLKAFFEGFIELQKNKRQIDLLR